MANDFKERIKIVTELDKNLLVSASAGSGKTTTLVERMIALVESGNVSLSKMAALTFTKKAAGEFYDRFYKKLQLRIRPNFDKAKMDEYSLLSNPTKIEVERDKKALKEIDTCFFGTIDSFYQKILNEHPLEAGIPSNSTIIDDDEFNNLLIKKFSEYIKSNDPKIREAAEKFNSLVGAKCFPQLMANILKNKELKLYQIPDKPEIILKSINNYVKDFKTGVRILLNNEALLKVRKKDGTLTDDDKNAWDYIQKNINYIECLEENDIKGILKTLKNIKIFKFDAAGENLFTRGSFLMSFCTLSKNQKYYTFNKNYLELVQKYVFVTSIAFLDSCKKDIEQTLLDNGMLTFDEATSCLLNLLRNETKYQSVIQQIRNKIDCLLIDECQDTDIKQYEIFFRLVAKDFNSDFAKLTIEGGRLYACGDRKQGIYHFRGADVSTFDKIKSIFDSKKSIGLPYDIVLLTDNYRSKGKLIKCFNKTFEKVLSNQGYDRILNDDIKDDPKLFGVRKYITGKDDDPQKVADLIIKCKEEENYKYKDFMIITPSKNPISDYAKEFTRRGIPFYSEGNINLNAAPLINVAVNLFKYFASKKQDKIAYFEVLTSPLFNFDVKKTIDTKENYFAKIGIDIDKLPNQPSKLLEEFVSNECILNALNIEGLEVIVGLVHLLKEQEYNGLISSYKDAIKYFNDLQSGEKELERLSLLQRDIDAVKIANAHKTKGLENKVVIVTKAGTHTPPLNSLKTDKEYVILSHGIEMPNGNSYSVLTNPCADIEPILSLKEGEKDYNKCEKDRLLYVIATRAREYLYISNPIDDEGKEISNKYKDLAVDIPKSDSIQILGDFEVNRQFTSLEKFTSPAIGYDKTSKSIDLVTPSKVDIFSKGNEELHQIRNDDALVFGTMVHKLLECIVKAKSQKLDKDISSLIARKYERIDLADKLDSVREKIYLGGYAQDECPFSDIYSQIKESNCLTEVPFSYRDGNLVVSGFIDLVIEQKDKVIIIDYKTDILKEDHSKQLKCYVDALKKTNAFGKKPISSYIYNIRK